MNNNMPRRWYASDFFLSMFATLFGVMIAFWLTEWANERDFKDKERHLLMEIQHELELNLKDLKLNMEGHKAGLAAVKSIQTYLQTDTISLDTLPQRYLDALRDFISIQHTAAYETMKARGLESISNDSLRLNIADLYDFEFETIEKIEETFEPHEFFDHYNEPFLKVISKCYDFTPGAKNKRIMPLSALPKEEKNLLHARLMKLRYDRLFSMAFYSEVVKKVEMTIEAIKKELGT